MGVLISPGLIKGVAIRPVSQGRALVPDRREQDFIGGVSQTFDLRAGQPIGTVFGVDAGDVQDLAGVQIADAGHERLIEESHLDRASPRDKDITPAVGGKSDRIGTESSAALQILQFRCVEQP